MYTSEIWQKRTYYIPILEPIHESNTVKVEHLYIMNLDATYQITIFAFNDAMEADII